MTPVEQSYREITLTRGQVAIVDAEDYVWLSQWKWNAHWGKNAQKFYATRADYVAGENHHQVMVRMHRAIMGLERYDKRMVDHINGNGLDNRRSNLRVCDCAQNRQNSPKRRDNTSGFKGVNRSKGRFMARINFRGKSKYLGIFATAEEAHEAYKTAAVKIHGEFANY